MAASGNGAGVCDYTYTHVCVSSHIVYEEIENTHNSPVDSLIQLLSVLILELETCIAVRLSGFPHSGRQLLSLNGLVPY